MELSHYAYFVCEEEGGVSLDIIRRGNLAESSYVSVQVSRHPPAQSRQRGDLPTSILLSRWRRGRLPSAATTSLVTPRWSNLIQVGANVGPGMGGDSRVITAIRLFRGVPEELEHSGPPGRAGGSGRDV